MKNKLLHSVLSLAAAALVLLALLPRPAYAAGASLSGSSSVQAGGSVTLTLSVSSKIYGLTADLNCGDGLTFSNYSCSVSGWSILVNQNHFSVYGTSSSSGAVITVTLKVSSSALADTALSASFSNIVASDGDSDIDLGSASWSGKVAAAPSGDCSLSAIICGNATLSPAFSPNTTFYTAKVPYSVSKLNLDYNRVDKSQSVTISGNDLAVGVNTITLKVTAANGATRSYVIEVTREQDPNYKPSDDASLSSLAIEGAALSPAFSADVTDYIAYVPFETQKVTLSAAAASSKAEGVTGTGEQTVEQEGDNALVVTCTAEDKTTKKEYTIHVFRMPAYTGVLPTVSVTEPAPAPDVEPEPEVPTLSIPVNVKLPLLGEVRTLVAAGGGVFLLVVLLFLLGLFIGRSTAGAGDDGDDDGGPAGPDRRDDRRHDRDHRRDRRDHRPEERPRPAPERPRSTPRIVPRQPEPARAPAPKARDWKDFDIPLDDDTPVPPPAPKPAVKPVRDAVEDTVSRTLADEPAPKDEADVRTMSLEDLLKDIHDM
mgnify:FL=1